ncbi:MAG: DUF5625 family protein [Syntrophales bacterium]
MEDKKHFREIVGDGAHNPADNWRYVKPGVVIPIHVRITRHETGKDDEIVYEDTVGTEGMYASIKGSFLRCVDVVDLKPGIYRIEANAVKDSPEFSGIPSYLIIEPHWQLKFMPHIR